MVQQTSRNLGEQYRRMDEIFPKNDENKSLKSVFHRALDPHSLFADPDLDPAVFLSADPDPALTNL